MEMIDMSEKVSSIFRTYLLLHVILLVFYDGWSCIRTLWFCFAGRVLDAQRFYRYPTSICLQRVKVIALHILLNMLLNDA